MIEAPNILGAIIAGGQGTRLGSSNKALQLLAGKPLIHHVHERLRHQTERVIVNANRDIEAIKAALPDETPIVSDVPRYAGRGPLAGLHSCLQTADQLGFGHLLTAPTDTPFFPSDIAMKLAGNPDRAAIRMAAHGGYRHPLFALWPVSLLSDLTQFLNEADQNKVTVFAERHTLIEIDFSSHNDPFFNINTPADLAKAEAMIAKPVA
ncbi:MAG: molybdenum cofactor guanylyltransferase MobA [Pseudomonadota bacterium]